VSPEAEVRASQRRQCAAKRRYRDLDEAKRVRQHQRAITGDDIRIYDCPICSGFHFTSQPIRP
jgi:hypothetical protein